MKYSYYFVLIISICFISCRHSSTGLTFFHHAPDEQSFFKDIRPGISRDSYNDYIETYKKASIIDSNCGFHFKQYGLVTEIEGDYPMKNFLNYFKIRFENEKQNDKPLTMDDLQHLSGFFTKVYGRPDVAILSDTSKLGYNYLQWNKLENYIVKLDFDRSRGTNTIRLYMWAKPELESMMQKNRVSGYMFSNNPVLDRYLKSIVFGHNLDSISKCAKRDFAVKKYYLFNGEIWPDGNYDFRAKYAREKYGLRFFVTSDIRHEGEEAYQNTMAKLLMDIKMPGPGKIKREADSLYYKTHKRED